MTLDTVTHMTLHLPSPEYSHVFDVCALEANHNSGKVGVLATGSYFVHEMTRRLNSDNSAALRVINPADNLPAGQPPVSTLIAILPDNAEHCLTHLMPGGQLIAVVPGWMYPLLPKLPFATPASPIYARQLLAYPELALEKHYGFHTLGSVTAGYISRLWGLVGRLNLADRWLYRMRADYVTDRVMAVTTPNLMILRRKEVA